VSIIEPDGIVKAWMISVRITSASRMAMKIASAYSRTTDLRLRAGGAESTATASGFRISVSRTSIRS